MGDTDEKSCLCGLGVLGGFRFFVPIREIREIRGYALDPAVRMNTVNSIGV